MLSQNRDGGATAPGGGATSVGLPDTPDYHSLLVDPANTERVTLGTHAGLFRTVDGGRTWRAAELSGQDAMNLVRTEGRLWAAGHLVLARAHDIRLALSQERTARDVTPHQPPLI